MSNAETNTVNLARNMILTKANELYTIVESLECSMRKEDMQTIADCITSVMEKLDALHNFATVRASSEDKEGKYV